MSADKHFFSKIERRRIFFDASLRPLREAMPAAVRLLGGMWVYMEDDQGPPLPRLFCTDIQLAMACLESCLLSRYLLFTFSTSSFKKGEGESRGPRERSLSVYPPAEFWFLPCCLSFRRPQTSTAFFAPRRRMRTLQSPRLEYVSPEIHVCREKEKETHP